MGTRNAAINQYEDFIKETEANSDLREKFSALCATGATIDAVITFAAEHGFVFSREDMGNLPASDPPKEPVPLKPEELSDVVGGTQVGGSGSGAKYCFFTPTGKESIGGDDMVWLECGVYCGFGSDANLCACWGKSHCVNKWHMCGPKNSFPRELWPVSHRNHQAKKPPTYRTE
ncbi:MAG: Nif11-like leader peptide family natural product precursor [Oscillospiraceae bacterium]|nr:Nif11-like leader peptide family natural product precursor [Oscillospiraceae bacterium]